jgi:lipid II:glycine glycyltransferase (peptidoglycan interpeptide bridge formation enzyme)
MDLRQTKEFADFMKLCEWKVEKIGPNYAYLKKVLFLPPLILKIPYPEPPVAFREIETMVNKYRPFSVQIQPQKYELGFKKHGYHLSHSSGHVTKTVQLDLTQPIDKIMANFEKDTRYSIKKAQERNIKILRYYDIEEVEKFHQSWKKSVSWKRYVPSLNTLTKLKKAFGKKAIFLVVQNSSQNRSIIAGTVILLTNKTAYYYYAFTAKEGRKKFAQYLLVLEAIKLAKKLGCLIFDFEGIFDERFPIKSWKGFTHFKQKFGGKEVEYPGCFVKHRFPF